MFNFHWKKPIPTIFIRNRLYLPLLVTYLAFVTCGPTRDKTNLETRKEYLKGVGLPILVSIQPRHNRDKKELQLFIKTENLTKIKIHTFQILFFASDQNRQFLIPDEQKTPELICLIPKTILPDTIYKCNVGPFVYSQLWNSIVIHSISFTTEDKVRHVISEDDIDDVVIWL
ncbi:hypothetical protein [Leptospira levettii]|uniref:hypothetical protein n=1 Tax=Leptospira levettii TaxID=2023178 RepID=UPI001FAFF7EC|nr:hypothetical protein [Leptospira levettii]MCW7508941.1 hypothetical protein [Leptospira levettii]MCW7520030.1 hypothetical protein [Leptospira levettii]